MQPLLKVYKASAGSGKTFTLAVEYIKLLINSSEAYKHILAVTFTNKATSEMKERILSQLYGIANSCKSSDSYFNVVRESFPHLDDREIRNRAKKALGNMLHDYSHFRIQTIDAFFQTLLRSLARELELSGDLNITLETGEVLSDTVDTLIKKLTPTSKEMMWIVEYIEEHLSNNKSWRIKDALKDFSSNLLNEIYQQRGESLRNQIDSSDGLLLVEFRKSIKKIAKEIEESSKNNAAHFFKTAYEHGLTESDFLGKSRGIWSYFTKLQRGDLSSSNKSVTDGIASPEKISKGISDELQQQFLKILSTTEEERTINLPIIISCQLSLSKFHQLRLLNCIAQLLNEENSRENRFLLSQTTYLLSQMIVGNTSFVFEKIGAEIQHILIDEFQDTSSLQWKSFSILLQELLSRGKMSLIVGDVKQSIYRWRNSDWSILNDLQNHLPHQSIDFRTLNVNRRSSTRVVTFNNALFQKASTLLANQYKERLAESGDELLKAYEDVEQEIPRNSEASGYVEVSMLNDKTYIEAAMDKLIDTLKNLLTQKYVKQEDITILVRQNKEIPIIAERFNREFSDYTLVSDDAYKLHSSTALELLIDALKYIYNPYARINLYTLLVNYNLTIKGKRISGNDILSIENPKELLPNELNDNLQDLLNCPLYELLEKLARILELGSIEGQQSYLFTFFDIASDYINNNETDIKKFITAWEDTLSTKSIPSGQMQGVRILSIHKSKGLEFHTVIIPFCTWELASAHSNLIWCEPKIEPFNTLNLIPIPSSKNMLNSIYKKEYHREHLFQLVDNLNILYVACTRASKNLFIFSDSQETRNDSLSKLLTTLLPNITIDEAIYNSEENKFIYGAIEPSINKPTTQSDNPFTKIPQTITQDFESYESRLTFRQSNRSTVFMAGDDDERRQSEYIVQGELLHEVFSKLTTKQQLSQQLRRLLCEGLIATEKELNKIKKLAIKALDNPFAEDWFSGRYTIYNECSIVYRSNNILHNRRPDRVMIIDNSAIVVDFKFGKRKREYIEQINEYMTLLKTMGYTRIKGYLWFIYDNIIDEVKLESKNP